MARNQIGRGKNITQPIETNFFLSLEAQGLVQDVLYLEIFQKSSQALTPFGAFWDTLCCYFHPVSKPFLNTMTAVKDT